MVQRILDDGEVFRAGPLVAVGFVEADGKFWRAVIKATGDGKETWLQTLHRAEERHLGRARRRLERIER